MICAAAGHLYKIINSVKSAAKSPWERVHSRIDSLEANQNKMLSELSSQDQIIARLELLNLIQHYPENDIAIEQAWGTYERKDYNSYMREVIKDWRKTNEIH